MKIAFLVFGILISATTVVNAQKDTTKAPKKSLSEKIEALPDVLIPFGTNPTDSAMSILKNENLTLIVNPTWNEKGTQTNNDLKVLKCTEDPVVGTFPLPEKTLLNNLIITMTTKKMSPEDKKNAILGAAKTHLAAYYKEAGKAITADELATNAKSFTSDPETFKTTEGKEGQLYFLNDIAPQQTSYIGLFVTPGAKPGTTVFVQFTFTRFTYESIVPDDYTELKFFVYPDDQKLYEAFIKKYLKTLKIQ
jgi:hypothetical protein